MSSTTTVLPGTTYSNETVASYDTIINDGSIENIFVDPYAGILEEPDSDGSKITLSGPQSLLETEAGATSSVVLVLEGGNNSVYGLNVSGTIDGGIGVIQSGGADDGEIVMGNSSDRGVQELLSGSKADGTVLEDFSTQSESAGATVTSTTDDLGSVQGIYGTAIGTDVEGGLQIVGSSALALDTTLHSGTQTASAGSTVTNDTADLGSDVNIKGLLDGTTTIDGGDVVINGGGTISGDVTLAEGTLGLATTALTTGMTLHIDPQAIIVIETPDPMNDTVTIAPGNMLEIDIGGATFDLQLDKGEDFSHDTFSLAADGNNTAVELADNALCFVRGTRILTKEGETAVENLKAGDRVVTPGGFLEEVEWIGTKGYNGGFVEKNLLMWPVRIKAGAISDGVPERDVCVSAGHGIWIQKEESEEYVLVPAWRLANGISILHAPNAGQDPMATHDINATPDLHYVHIQLKKGKHGIVYAGGLPSETLVDRRPGMFDNERNAPKVTNVKPLPRIEGGWDLYDIQRRINARAGIEEQTERAGTFIDYEADEKYEGHVDEPWTGMENVVNGWAYLPSRPDVTVFVDIIVDEKDGRKTYKVPANYDRDDLRRAGKGNGVHGFRLDLGSPQNKLVEVNVSRTQKPITLTVQARHAWKLAQTEPFLPRRASLKEGALRGYVDGVNGGVIMGWAQDEKNLRSPVLLDIVDSDENLVAQVYAQDYRQDLDGIPETGKGNGYHGFAAALPEGLTGILLVRRHSDGAKLGPIMVSEENCTPVRSTSQAVAISPRQRIVRQGNATPTLEIAA